MPAIEFNDKFFLLSDDCSRVDRELSSQEFDSLSQGEEIESSWELSPALEAELDKLTEAPE